MKNKFYFFRILYAAREAAYKKFQKKSIFGLFTFVLLALAITPQAALAWTATNIVFTTSEISFDEDLPDGENLSNVGVQCPADIDWLPNYTPRSDITVVAHHVTIPSADYDGTSYTGCTFRAYGDIVNDENAAISFDIPTLAGPTPTPGVLGAVVTLDPTTKANINAGVGSLGTIGIGQMVDILPYVWPVLAVLIAISVAIGFFKRHSGVKGGEAVSTNSWVESSEGIKSHEHFD